MGVQLDHLTICVSDWSAYERHYGTLLPLVGFSRADEATWKDDSGFFLQFRKAGDGSRPYERYGAGLNHWGVRMPSADSVEELRQSLIAAGLDIQPIQYLGGAIALFVPDPDGLRAEFTFCPEGIDPVG